MTFSEIWWSLLFNDWYDIFVAIVAFIGFILLMYQLYLYDWDIKALLYEEL